MTKLMTFITLFTLTISVHAQKAKWWKVEDGAVSYKLPADWSSDPFSTSSVCHCPGTINDNRGWRAPDYAGMVVYPLYDPEDAAENHQQIWGNKYVPNSAPDTVEFAGIRYVSTYGSLPEESLGTAAWQLKSIEEGAHHRHYTVYFFTDPSKFEERVPQFKSILKTFDRKVKKD